MFPTVDTDIEDISQVTSINRNSSPSRDVQHSLENTQVAKQNTREITIKMFIKEMIFCVALALTTYGALHNTPSKVSKHPQAVRFFSPHSAVTDWYKGQLGNALATVNNADISFVMYYAPWDAESQFVRGEFEKAAEVLSERVHFSAINCWNPGSECRLQHNKIPSWPILMVYTVNSRGVLYKGPRDAHSMVKFLELIMKPLQRVSCTEDLVNLLSLCDAVAVGFTPITDTSKHYNVWYSFALKSKEFDVMGEICFATVTSEELSMELGVDSVPSARLMLWNDTKEYKVEDNLGAWNESSLMNWLLENFNQPVARIIPMWKKAFSFERYFDGNPILMLFTPLNPLYEQLPSYDLLREVAMEYYNCNKNGTSQWISELIKLQQVQRLLYQQKDYVIFCQDYKFKAAPLKPNRYYKKEVVSHNNKYPWTNTTQKNQKNELFNFLVKRGLAISKVMESADDDLELLSSLELLQECSSKVLPAEKSFYDNIEQCQSIEENLNFGQNLDAYLGDTETSMLPVENDPLSTENLIQDNVKHFCKLIKFANEWGPVVSPGNVNNTSITHVHGLACAKNFTLYMIALDSVHNHHFAESLGIDISNKKDRTAVVILDSKHESQYVLSEEYNAKTLRDFIYNYTHKSMKRSLRTHVGHAAHTHYFGSDGDTKQSTAPADGTVRVVDLTTRTFRRVVKTPGTVTVVAICGGECGGHTTLSITEAVRLLTTCGVAARAARLDALRHDLPWHYTASSYPTVLVFVPTRGAEPESRAYPARARLSAGGVLALALRSLGTPHTLRVRLALCARAQANPEKKICLKELKEQLTTIIGRNLKYWRRTENKDLRDALLKRLQDLNRVSLDLSLLHATDLSQMSGTHDSLLRSLSSLSKNWDIDASILRNNVTVPKKSS